MKNLLISTLLLIVMIGEIKAFDVNPSTYAIVPNDPSFPLTISKNDIKKIVKMYGKERVHGLPFDIRSAQEVLEEADNDSYEARQKVFQKKYGSHPLANILFLAATGALTIKKMETQYVMVGTITDHQQIVIESYDNDSSALFQKDKTIEGCLVSYRTLEEKTTCEHDPGSSGMASLGLFVFTMGTFGSPNAYRRERTECISVRPISVIQERLTPNGTKILAEEKYSVRGRTTVYDENVWFRGNMKDRARNLSQQAFDEMELSYSFATCQTLPAVSELSEDNSHIESGAHEIQIADHSRDDSEKAPVKNSNSPVSSMSM